MSIAGSFSLRWCLMFGAGMVPFAWEFYRALAGLLGADPAKELTEALGDWAILLLILTLSVTPLRQYFGQRWLLRFRRMIGLYALFYALLHVMSYMFLLADWYDWVEDLLNRPYILLGALALPMLIAMGVTSTKGMMRKLGRRWKQLHSSVYLVAVLVAVHQLWQARGDLFVPLLYCLILGVLLLLRFKSLAGYLLSKRQA